MILPVHVRPRTCRAEGFSRASCIASFTESFCFGSRHPRNNHLIEVVTRTLTGAEVDARPVYAKVGQDPADAGSGVGKSYGAVCCVSAGVTRHVQGVFGEASDSVWA
jgi:hypothetical protein